MAGPSRNNTPEGKNIPIKFSAEEKENLRWTAKLGSQTYGNPVIANGKVFVGTNNGAGYVKRYPASVDLGCLLCFDEKTGKFLWQDSNPKLPQGRVNDWPQQGVCSTPYCEGDRLWYVNNRGEVVCLDANGFYDGKNDGPYTAEPNENKDEADVIWKYDMMAQMGVAQHNMCSCSICCVGDVLFVCTSNGVDFDHINIPSPERTQLFRHGQEHGQGAVDRQVARTQHPARPMVVAGLRRVGRTAAGALRRRRRLAVQLRSGRRRPRSFARAVEVRLQSEDGQILHRRPRDAKSHHRHTGDL